MKFDFRAHPAYSVVQSIGWIVRLYVLNSMRRKDLDFFFVHIRHNPMEIHLGYRFHSYHWPSCQKAVS